MRECLTRLYRLWNADRHWVRTGIVLLVTMVAAVGAAVPSHGAENPAVEKGRSMGRGINILGYDGIWSGHDNAPFQLQWLKMIHDAGFGHVRINLHAFQYIDDKGRLDPDLLPRLDRVLSAAVKTGLVPVVDEHDFESCQRDAALCEKKLVAFWTAAGAYFADRQPDAVFELLNEPAGDLSQQQWNDLSRRLLRILRKSSPKRTIIVAVLNVEDAEQINGLQLPQDDQNVIVTFHYYKPMRFTHQGAPWERKYSGLRDIGWGSEAERELVTSDFDAVEAWAKATGRPVYLGEFGVFDRAPGGARAEYISFMARSAERRGWSWAYWQFDHDFAAFNNETQAWVPDILNALVPGKPAK